MLVFAAPQASIPGIIGSIAGVITALTVLIGAVVGGIKVIIPLLRETRRNTAQLGIIHTLVNSTLTATQQAVLDGARREVYLLEDAQRLHRFAGEEPTEDQEAYLGAARRRVDELTLAMRDRERQTRAADIQIQRDRQTGGK